MLLEILWYLCCYDVDLSDKYQEIYVDVSRDLFFSYVISLFLLMIFVFDLTNPYWYQYLREKNVTWFFNQLSSTNISCHYHVMWKKATFHMKANFHMQSIYFLFIFYWLLHDIYLNGNDFSNCMIWIVTWR